MKRIVRLTESDLARIVRRVIIEQDEDDMINKYGKKFDNKLLSPDSEDEKHGLGLNKVEITNANVSDCIDLMDRIDDTDMIGGSPFEDLVIDGDVDITYNGTVSPGSRSLTIIKNGKPFCKIPVKNGIGDCGNEMETTSKAPGSPLMASLDGTVKINITGTVAPQYRGTIIRDAGGYFCRVPDSLSESRRRRGYRY